MEVRGAVIIAALATILAMVPLGEQIADERVRRSPACHEGYFMCNSSKLCIEQRFICNGIKNCEDGSDEWNCDDRLQDEFWNNLFRKRPDEDRESIIEPCAHNSTQLMSCDCSWKSLFCENAGLTEFPTSIPSEVEVLDFSGNDLGVINSSSFPHLGVLEKLILNNANISSMEKLTFQTLPELQELYLSGNNIERIVNHTFLGSWELRLLIMSHNPLRELEIAAFVGLSGLEELDLRSCHLTSLRRLMFRPVRRLRILWLEENKFVSIPNGTFRYLHQLQILSLARNQLISVHGATLFGLVSLRQLALSFNLLTYLKTNHFGNLTSLMQLDLKHNEIYRVDEHAFKYLPNLQSLNLKNNPLMRVRSNSFSSLKSLEHIYFQNFYMCSYAIHVRICEPKGDGISSTSHLLDSVVLRISVWIVAAVACVGNICVLVGRSLMTESNKIHSFYIKNLSVADFLMGIYLFIIAGHDVAFRGEYIRHDVQWRQSWQCILAGALSVISSEASIFILTIITIDRYLSIICPLSLRRRTFSVACASIGTIWVVTLLIALLPMIFVGYFGDVYYGSNGVCLPLQIHNPFSSGWEYSLVVFCGLNTVAFVFIFFAYTQMFVTISKSKLGIRSSQQQKDRAIAKRFAFIVGTDFLCWVPIITLKFVALAGADINQNLYAWMAVLLLPINSALNPALYTLTTKLFKQHLSKIAYTWRVNRLATQNAAETSGISLSSVMMYNGKYARHTNSATVSDNSMASMRELQMDRSVSRSSLLSANSRSSGRHNWPSATAFIIDQNSSH